MIRKGAISGAAIAVYRRSMMTPTPLRSDGKDKQESGVCVCAELYASLFTKFISG